MDKYGVLFIIFLIANGAPHIRAQNSISENYIDSLVDKLYISPQLVDSVCTYLIENTCPDDHSIFLIRRIESIAQHLRGDFLGSIHSINLLLDECKKDNSLNSLYYTILKLDLSALYSEIGYYKRAIESYLDLLTHKQSKHLSTPQKSNALINLASIYTSINDFQTSFAYLKECSGFINSMDTIDRIRYHAIWAQNSLIMGDTNKSISYLTKSPLINHTLYAGTNLEKLIIKTIITRALNNASHPTLPQELITSIINQKLSPSDPPDVKIDYLLAVSAFHLRQGEPEISEHYLSQIGSIIDQSFQDGSNRFKRSMLYMHSQIKLYQSDTTSALSLLKAICSSTSLNNTDLIKSNLELSRLYFALDSFSESLKHLHQSSILLNEHMNMYSNEKSTNQSSLKAYKLISQMVDLKNLPSQMEFSDFFEYARHSSLIRWHMENNRNRNILGPKLFPKWLEAKGKLKFLNEFCKENKINTIQCHQIKEHLRDEIQNYKSIIRNAKHSYPNRKNYIINSGAIIYILEGKKYYHFGLITESKNLLHHKVRKRFCKSLITEYLQLQRINANEAKYFHNLSKSLFRIIFPDLLHLDETSHLTIIPDGDFHKLSFESLLLPESTDSNPVYLIEKIPISYSLGRQLSRNFDNLDNNKIASFSPSFDNTGVASRRSCANNSYSQLVCNSEEAASSAALLNGSHFDADKASVHNFLSSISNYDIIHIASHACIDTTDYLNSRLILNDGEVTVRDLYNVDFNGKTIILSACSTAEGRVMSGEGVFNLVRVMTELGCRDMIVSLWPIDDCETSKLLADYFSNLSKGIPPAVSLQQAKRDYLKNADKLRSQPFFWAPLIYISNDINTPSLSISFKKQERIKKVVTLCTGIGLGALTIGLFLKKRWGQAAA